MGDCTVAICDDDPRQTAFLHRLTAKWGRARGLALRVAEHPSAEAFLFDCDGCAADILLLDIEMAGMNGIELARRVRENDRRAQIVFITGYTDYLADGYDVEALHYLLKPVEEEKLFSVLDRAVQRLADRSRGLLVESEDGLCRLLLADIRWIEVRGNYATIHAQRDYTIKKPLKELEAQLDDSFFRTGRSFLVNLRFVESVSRTEVLLRGGGTVPLSRGSYDALHRAMIAYF